MEPAFRIHNYKIYRISTNYGEPSRLRSVFVLKMHGWRNRFQKVWLVLFFTLWAWQMDLLCKIKPRKPYKIKQKKKKRKGCTYRQVLNRWSIRSCGRNEKTLQKNNTYIHTYSSLAVYYYYYRVQSSRVLVPCWYPIQTQYHGCHSWGLNVVITQNWVYTLRTGRGQLWLNFIFKHVFYLLCIVHFGDKKKKASVRNETVWSSSRKSIN